MLQYIDKSAIVAEIERKKISFKKDIDDGVYPAYLCALMDFEEFLDTLDVKEVDEEYNGKAMLNNLWHPADGNDLPEIDREVIALLTNGKVCFAHRPNPNGWDGRNILTGEVNHYTPKTYDNGGWNGPDVRWWLDLDLPIEK